jgi:hypothetical protein
MEQYMANNPVQFATKATGCARKLAIIQWQTNIIKNQFPNKEKFKGFCIGLPGGGMQAERHRDEYLAYGIPEQRQFMVEKCHTVHLTQVQAMRKLNYKGQIICGDLMTVAQAIWNHKLHIDIIDFDGVSYLLPEHETAIWQASKNNVNVFILVLTSRCNRLTDMHEKWKGILKLEKVYVKSKKKYQEPIGRIQVEAVTQIANNAGFDVYCKPYSSHPPMMSFVLINRNTCKNPK